MSKHSNSLGTASLQTQSGSFFDVSLNMQKFWKQVDADEKIFSGHSTIIENDFRYKNKSFFSDWSTCTLTIKGSFLIVKKHKKSSHAQYIDLDEHMYRIELIQSGTKKYSSKQPFAFSIYSNGKSVDFYCKEKSQLSKWLNAFRKQCVMTNFQDNYKIHEVIGTGGYGKVHLVENLETNTKYAGKFIKLGSIPSKERQKSMITNEIKILRKLDHPNIVKLYEVYEMQGQICLVMELALGEKLLSFITKNKEVNEQSIALVMKQLFIVLNYLENMDVIHRDIKPENILYTTDEKGRVTIKVVDFGLATFHKKRDAIRKCGTPGYVAPEVLKNEFYNHKADLYSLGIIMYICLTRRPAFYGRDYEELMLRNKEGLIRFRGSTWSTLSYAAQDLVQKLLEPFPDHRLSLADAISHQWLIQNMSEQDIKDLSECMFKVVRLTIPEEKHISIVPISLGKIPYVRKSKVESLQEATEIHKNITPSFIGSHLLGLEDGRELNSFYKRTSKDWTSTSHQSLNVSRILGSATSSKASLSHIAPNYNYNINAPSPMRNPNLLFPPHLQTNSPRRSNTQPISQRSRNKSSEFSKYDKGYTIKVSVADLVYDIEEFSSDEASLCSIKYDDFKRNSMYFSKRISAKKQSLFELDTGVTIHNITSTKRFETCPDTPRIKAKVTAISNGVRNYIMSSSDDF